MLKDASSKTKKPREEKKDMDHQEIYRFLEKDFQDTFIRELLPGIVHNFANPLNGIMGRSRLLQRKLADIMKKSNTEREASYLDDSKKLVYDVESIAREADRLSGMLQHVAGKFCTLSDDTIQKLDLSELIELEIKFFDFYLDFKHSIKKTMQLDRELPEIKGSPADYSMALTALIRYSMDVMKESALKEFHISTSFENGCVYMKIQNHGVPISEEQKKMLLQESQIDVSSSDITRGGALVCAFSLLKKWGARFSIESNSHVNTITISIPCR